jgi:glycosyltransferase involved in cell wall biosynthesis
MTHHPKVSVIMPVYDAERYLKQSIDSILNQSFGDFEFIIVSEYGTSDESIAIIESYHDPRIRHIRNTRRLGLARSLNVALKEAQGEYVASQDADDVSSQVRLEREVEFLDEHPRIGVVGSWFEAIDENGRVISENRTPVESAVVKWRLLFCCPIANSSTMVRRAIYEALEGYDARLRLAQDYEFWTRASQITEFANLTDILLRYRVHSASLSVANERALYEATLAISKNAIAATLGKDVSPKSLEIMARPDLARNMKPREILDAAMAFDDLCLRYSSQMTEETEGERRLVRFVSARTLLRLAMFCMKRNVIFSLVILTTIPRLLRDRFFVISALALVSYFTRVAQAFV